MTNICDSMSSLELYLLEVEEKYLDPHFGKIESPSDYMFDVKSYCILCHAAFEEFIENICLATLNELCENYIKLQRISYSTLCLLHFSSSALNINDDTWNDNQQLFDYFKNKINEVKQVYSKYIMIDNHGVRLKYLKKMLIPLGIDIPQDPIQQNSLLQLADFRGGFAHTSKRVSKSLAPEDAKRYVNDIYGMMQNIATHARHIHYYSIH